MTLALVVAASFGLTALLVPLAARIAQRAGAYAHPKIDRWHDRTVPTLGGIAMMGGLSMVVIAGGVLPTLWPVLLASSLMFLVGLLDDLRSLSALVKLGLQCAIAGLLVYLLPPIDVSGSPVIDNLIAFAWIVGITNAFNLLDNMDGLAAGVAAIAGIFFLLILRLDGAATDATVSIAVAALIGAAGGFLLYNFQPASIFMGDGGSLLIGSFLAGTSLFAMPTISRDLAPVAAIPVVLLLIPILDTAFVTITRRLQGRSAFVGGRDHLSHRLAALGIGERRAVLTLYALTFVGGCVALGLRVLSPVASLGFGLLYVALLGVIGVYLGHVTTARSIAPPDPPLLAEITHRHRGFEVLLDILATGCAYYFAFLIRFREPQLSRFLPIFTESLPIVIGTQLGVLWMSGKYRQVWRWVSAAAIVPLLKSALVGVACSVLVLLYVYRFEGFSRFVFAFDAILAPIFIVGVRVTLGALDEYMTGRRRPGRPALVLGAGRSGALLVRELLHNRKISLKPLGFIDNHPNNLDQTMDGLAIVCSLDGLEAFLDRRSPVIRVVVVSVDDVPLQTLERVTTICAARGIDVLRMRVTVDQIDDDIDANPKTGSLLRFPGA